jgi:uncharacterized protein (TIGR02597 family)
MKKNILALIVCTQTAFTALAQQTSGFSSDTTGQQYISVNAGATGIIAPEFQPPTTALFSVLKVTSSGNTTTLTLAGTPPCDSYGAPVLAKKYDKKKYPVYYALVTSGDLTGNFYSVVSNTADKIVIDTPGVSLSSAGIKAIDLRPYWTLETLFPASASGAAFIKTTSSNNIMTKLILSPVSVTGTQNPLNFGQTFYFSSSVNNWVSSTAPNVSAGGIPVPPGRYLYIQNTGTNSFPLDAYFAGTVLKTPFRVTLYSSSKSVVKTLFALPRASSYKLSDIGFDDLNFSSSKVGFLTDVFAVDNSQGGVSNRYYKSGKNWYSVGSSMPVNPSIPVGTAFAVTKPSVVGVNKSLLNKTNK